MDLQKLLVSIPAGLRQPLVSEYEALLREAVHTDWEKVGLKAGKICEIVYCVLEGLFSGIYSSKPYKPDNMVASCTAFEKKPQTFPRAVRIQIPRVLIAIYEMRNNRAIGHAGGDLSPNEMDGLFFLQAAKWIMGEIVRVYVGLNIEEAHAALNAINTRWSPLIWEKDGEKRALQPQATASEKVLALLYFSELSAKRVELQKWTEYANPTNFKTKVIRPLHKKLLIFFNETTDQVDLLPAGIARVEARLRSL
jgi:hypothetical protein